MRVRKHGSEVKGGRKDEMEEKEERDKGRGKQEGRRGERGLVEA